MGYGQYSYSTFEPQQRGKDAFDRVTGKRVKRVHTIAQVIHIWAQRTQTNGESGKGNVFFEADRLFDYGHHFCMGQFITNKAGHLACFLNSDSYGPTTSAHQGQTRGAIPKGIPVFTIPGAGYNSRLEWQNAHPIDVVAILESYRARATDWAGQGKRAREPYQKEWKTRHATDLLDEAEAFAEFFGHAYERPTLEGLATLDAETKKAAVLEAKRREEEARERDRVQFEEWQAGKAWHCPASWQADSRGGVRMRVVGDNLQTAKGAEVPLRHAVKVFRFIKKCRAENKDWHKNGMSVRCGHYQIDRIMSNGDFHAGCHFITWTQVEIAAKAAGVENLTPADARESTQAVA